MLKQKITTRYYIYFINSHKTLKHLIKEAVRSALNEGVDNR